MATRSNSLVFAVGIGAMFSILYLAFLLAPPSHAHFDKIPTEPKISQIQAVKTSEKHLLTRMPEVSDVRLGLQLYNFSAPGFESDPVYTEYLMNHYRNGWPLLQVEQNPELLGLTLFFVHANGTLYHVDPAGNSFEKSCEKPAHFCPLSVPATNAARDRLVYRVVLTWSNSSIPLNESLYLVDAETGDIVWNYVDFEMNRLPSPNLNLGDNRTISQLLDQSLHPEQTTHINIERGASSPDSRAGYLPNEVYLTLGVDNKVEWLNYDLVQHTVVSDRRYSNPYTGQFNSGIIQPGETYEYAFIESGEYQYHCDIHPWLRAKIIVVENFS